MTLTRATTFYKQTTCPASDALLAYRVAGSASSTPQHAWIESHIATCDFCGAEFQLLDEHPPVDDCTEAIEAVKMPLSLRCLAEALLTGNTLLAAALSFAAATSSRREKAPLTFTDA